MLTLHTPSQVLDHIEPLRMHADAAGTTLYVLRAGQLVRRTDRTDVGVWSWVVAPAGATGALLYVLWLTLTKFDVLLGITDPASPWPVILPASFAVAALLGAIWALLIKLTRPSTYATIGLGADSATATPAAAPTTALATPGGAR